ncbi:Nucleic acid-binding, OB-fold [Pseudocohnilembus persalinus]|uniref:Nucleic acid-binding, OB-fold n=1 Tax=Pseudocohnilembus persalinus TaxID=266149 RepID=A0A0V0QW91_PSEPJ|nr:Nucleic acid-binding, OB-fold [Pseudocohnilembus persalinus]|eukprot:KRX06468.1 Nucleic acid-binding, OB-fold [Pseudocohnilembus persalinus]
MKQEEETTAPHQTIIYTPISWLKANLQNWNIKARITNKPKSIQKFINQVNKTENQVFSIDLIDQEKSQIKGSFFGEACTQFFENLKIGKIYRFSKGHVKKASGAYGNKDGIQILFNEFSEIQELEEDKNIPINTYDFVKIKELKNKELNSVVDVIGIIIEKSKISQYQTQNKTVDKMSITIVDESGYKIQIGLWDEDTKLHKYDIGDCLILKQVKISLFKQTFILSTLFGSLIYLNNYDLPQCQDLLNWYQQTCVQDNYDNQKYMSNFKPLVKIETDNIVVNLFDIEQKCLLKAQENQNLEQKILSIYLNDENNKYKCEKCQQEYASPCPRYVAMINIQDSSGSLWVKIFDELANQLFVLNAEGLKLLKEQTSQQNDEKIKKLLQESIGKEFIFQLQSKIQFYNEQPKIMHNVLQIEEVNEISETQSFLKEINEISENKN